MATKKRKGRKLAAGDGATSSGSGAASMEPAAAEALESTPAEPAEGVGTGAMQRLAADAGQTFEESRRDAEAWVRDVRAAIRERPIRCAMMALGFGFVVGVMRG